MAPAYDHAPDRVRTLASFRKYLHALGRRDFLAASEHRRELLDLGLVVVWQPGLSKRCREAAALSQGDGRSDRFAGSEMPDAAGPTAASSETRVATATLKASRSLSTPPEQEGTPRV